jgi:2-desacetyl-2-hydroxyethyl bacteriochlorophyllide A dehydrogenase
VQFTAPYRVEISEQRLPPPRAGEVVVQSLLSAISPGTEGLIYRGEFPRGLAVDASLSALPGEFGYPLKYGYSLVGRVVALGRLAPAELLDRVVFAFHPHQDLFCAPAGGLLPLPAGVPPEAAVFLPNMETAVNLVMDAAPLIGERAVIFGQGIVGLLTAALLRQFPLESLVTYDCYPLRRQASLALGASASLDPRQAGWLEAGRSLLSSGADLALELSGAPEALDQAIALTGFAGRVVVGSWYGNKPVRLELGGQFHRSRIRLVSSQVSTLAPEHTGRWDKPRRFALAWEMLRRVAPQQWITQRYPLARADEAYQLLDQHPEETIQVVVEY